MAIDSKNIPLNFKPGVQRDGTDFDSDKYIDALWTRFDRGRPRKMGGYRLLTNTLNGASRALNGFSRNGITYVHSGHVDGLDMVPITSGGSAGVVANRTPMGFVADPANDWQFASTYNSTGLNTNLIAHAAPNLIDISNSIAQPYYVGDITDTAALVEVPDSDVSGGICCLQPFTFRYGDDGLIGWSDVNQPANITSGEAGEARPTGSKIVKGLPLRGTQSGPAGLFWALDSLIRATFEGGTTVWNFGTISDDISVMSADGIVEYDGIYYWAALERFQMFNGVVRELPNEDNLNWFLTNLNFAQRQKVFAMKVPRFGEIWWCFPAGNATECTHAVILNVRGGFWYDTALPIGFRSSSLYAQVYPYPLMGSPVVDEVTAGYQLWQHESGVDRIAGASRLAIESYHTTPFMTVDVLGMQGAPNALSVSTIEPDTIQSGELSVRLQYRANAKANTITTDERPIVEAPTEPAQQLAYFKEAGRQVSLRFRSNVVGGDYWMGKNQIELKPTGGRQT